MQSGVRLGPYEILAPLGAGGMGEVYRARDTRLGREVAVKLLRAEVAGDAGRIKRFEQEARTVASLSHPNILALFDVGSHDGQPYLVTELLEGQTLGERIRARDLTVGKAVELATQIARGLAAAHEHGIVHRDLKPGNVFVTKDGAVKILDFGLARLTMVDGGAWDRESAPTETGLTVARTVVGTVGYTAPEQLRGLPADQRSDIFAFGCVLYEMLSGQRAFQGDTPADISSAILSSDPPPLSGPGRAAPLALKGIVSRCLEKRPEERFSSAHDLGLALAAFTPEPWPGPQRKPAVGTGVLRVRAAAASRTLSLRVTQLSAPRARPLLRLLPALAAIGAVAFASMSIVRQRRAAWVRNEALPELARLADAEQHWPAFLLARRIEETVPGDPVLQKLRPRFASEFRRAVLPEGAKVLARRQDGGEADWVELGLLDGGPLPTPLGYSVFRVEHNGLEPREFAMTVHEFPWESYVSPGTLVLSQAGQNPAGMVRVDLPSEPTFFDLEPGVWEFATEGRVASFLVDAHEVTNREYKGFVDAGGYRRTEFWTVPFERDGRTISFDEAMDLLHDATGRPGPAGWEVGSYPAGADDYPVTGVSWYEAAAYAAFAGKRLPSVYHWALASVRGLGGDFVIGSNFSGSLAPVGSHRSSLNAWGLYDVAGNAREWCSNASGRERFALGGACDGPAYLFWGGETKPPFERSPTTGFRCIKPVASDAQEAQLDAPIARARIAPIEWQEARPLSDEVWESWRALLSYAKAPLDARVEWTDDTLPSWRMEKVSFAAAYGGERVVAYLFLPRSVPPPWQAVIFWPGAYAAVVGSSADGRNTLDASYWSYLVRDGRAVVYPILKGTFERGGHMEREPEVSAYHCILEAKDVFRSIDYLETRADIQKDRIGYLGFSWGAIAGPYVLSVEPRIKVQVLLGGGVYDPEMVGYVHRCTAPTQMVNGRSDGYDESQAPMFRALGAPADQKRHVVFEADHSLQGFQNEIVKVNLEWFDRFLGPTR